MVGYISAPSMCLPLRERDSQDFRPDAISNRVPTFHQESLPMNTAIVSQRARPARLAVAGLLLLALLCGLRAAPPARAALPSAIGRIAFVSNRFTGNPELYVMNADGSGLVRLTNNNAGEFSPHLVAGRPADRLCQHPRQRPRDQRHQRRRHRADQPLQPYGR